MTSQSKQKKQQTYKVYVGFGMEKDSYTRLLEILLREKLTDKGNG